MLKNLIPFLFFILFQPGRAAAQQKPEHLVLYSLTEENGLSDNQVTCFFQDSRGFMWIGTEDGLNIYDGSVIRSFKKGNSDSIQLAANAIFSITEDKFHHIWIGTANGLSEYDPQTNNFRSYIERENVKNINLMKDLAFDRSGNLWIASYAGLLEFIPSEKRFIRFTNNEDDKGNNLFNRLLIDAKNRIWIGAYSGLCSFIPSQQHFKNIAEPKLKGLINNMIMDHSGNIWIGFWSNGLKKWDPDKELLEDIGSPLIPRNINGISEIKDLQGNYSIWINPLLEYETSAKSAVKHSTFSTTGTTDYSTAIFYASPDKLLWIGTDKGVRIMDPDKQFFQQHILSSLPITTQGIAILQKGSNYYVGGTGDNFLKLYDSAFNFKKTVMSQPVVNEDGLMVRPALLNIVREDKDHIWLCTERGLILFNETTHDHKVFRLSTADISSPTRNFISNIFIDSRGNHWVFPWRSGIWHLDVKSGKFMQVIMGVTKENNEEKKLIVTSAAEDSNGNIWFADLDEGILFYDRSTGKFSKPTEQLLGSKYPAQNVISEKNFVWCVKTGSVFRIDINTKKIEQWPVPDEFNKNVTGFCNDHYDHLWILTSNGLLSFDKKEHTFKRYTANDGLIDNVLSGNLYPLDNGKILYAWYNYVIEFMPAQMINHDRIPPVVITGILSQNKPVTIELNKENEKYIDLDYTYNNFTFNWAILNYSNPLQNHYYCKLEGIDKDWKGVGYEGKAQYASLGPGQYIFRVKAATSEGVMNEKGDFVRIIIHPPFWRAWWFIILVSLVLLSSIIIVVRYISQRNLKEKLLLLEKEQAIEKERNRISRDMHDDLGSGLTKIAILSEVTKRQIHEPEKAKQQLENISASSRELVDNLQDIIWILNPKNDTLENLASYIREYALKFFEPFGTDMIFEYPEKFPSLKLSEETRRNIFLTVKEAFNNIAKHAWCNKVNICIMVSGNQISFVIQDDGKGFEINKIRAFGNGLINMQNRIEQIGGKYEIISEPGHGTKTIIKIPTSP